MTSLLSSAAGPLACPDVGAHHLHPIHVPGMASRDPDVVTPRHEDRHEPPPEHAGAPRDEHPCHGGGA
jgi:hypothetical protein